MQASAVDHENAAFARFVCPAQLGGELELGFGRVQAVELDASSRRRLAASEHRQQPAVGAGS